MNVPKIFKRVALGVLSTGTTLFIAACYGTGNYYDDDESWVSTIVQGLVSFNQQGVVGLEVCVTPDLPNGYSACVLTDAGGNYLIEEDDTYLDELNTAGGELTVTDVDGEDNGAYVDQIIAIAPGTIPASIDVELEELAPEE